MTARETQAELDRLAAVLGKALDRAAKVQLFPYAADCVYAHASTGDHIVETAAHLNSATAVAELRAILRADTDGAASEAFRAGAEAMREEVALAAGRVTASLNPAATVRAIPLPGGAFVSTDEAIAAVLDDLAALASEGPITAEMLRTMAAARRSR